MSDRIRVLLVDDDPDLAEVTGSFLEREDGRIAVESAPNATAGLERLGEGGIDCVVSDHDMPGPNGIEFLERVRERDADLRGTTRHITTSQAFQSTVAARVQHWLRS